MTELALQIKSLIERNGSLEAARKHYDILMMSIAEKEAELLGLKQQLDIELEEIEAMEKTSVQSILDQLMGNKDQKLEKERQDYFVLSLKIKELEKNIELTKYEASVLEGKASELEKNKALLEGLKQKRQEEILLTKDEKYEALNQSLTQIDDLQKYMVEVNEAIKAGNQVMIYLDQTTQDLNAALDFGSRDMYSKGRWAGVRKFEALQSASQYCFAANKALRLFQDELADIQIHEPWPLLPVEVFNTFTQEWIDNFISDWITQNKIKALSASIADYKIKLESMSNRLNEEITATETQIDEKMKWKDQWLSQ
jgi:hypothetical protein